MQPNFSQRLCRLRRLYAFTSARRDPGATAALRKAVHEVHLETEKAVFSLYLRQGRRDRFLEAAREVTRSPEAFAAYMRARKTEVGLPSRNCSQRPKSRPSTGTTRLPSSLITSRNGARGSRPCPKRSDESRFCSALKSDDTNANFSQLPEGLVP